jgi:hypothetical protein
VKPTSSASTRSPQEALDALTLTRSET